MVNPPGDRERPPFPRLARLKRYIPLPAAEEGSLEFWRERVLAAILITGLALTVFVSPAIIRLVLNEKVWGVALADGLGFFMAGYLLLSRKPSYEFKALLSLITGFGIGLAILLVMGPLSGGPVWLFFWAVLAGLLLGTRAAAAALVINTFTLAALGFLYLSGRIWTDTPFFTSLTRALVSGINFLILNALAAISAAVIIRSLSAAHQRQKSLAASLELERARLQEAKASLELEVMDRCQAEERFRRSETQFRTAFNNAPLGMALIDPDRRFLRVNPAFARMLGYSREELLGTSLDSLVNPGDMKACLTRYQKILDRGADYYSAETRFLNKEGSVVWVHVANSLVRDEAGEPVHFVCHFQDITKRKQAEKELREAEERLKLAIDAAEAGAWMWDLQTDLITADERARTINGLEPGLAPIRPDGWWERIHPDDVELIRSSGRRTVEKGLPFNCEYRALDRDGAWRTVSAQGAVFRDDHGRPVRMAGLCIDGTEREMALHALQESERRYSDLFGSISDWICTHDLEGRLLSVNPSAAKALGFTPEEMIGLPMIKMLEPELRSGFRQDYLKEIKSQGWARGTVKSRARDGRKYYIEYRNTLVRQEGREPYVSAVGRDITERIMTEREFKKLQQQLNQAQKMEAIGTLAGGIAHDFNNILYAIIGYTELALDRLGDTRKAKSDLKEVLRASDRAKNLVQQILNFSRQTDQSRSPVKLSSIIKEALKLLRATLPTTIEIRSEINDKLGTVLADPVQIHQVLMNLCANAGHAMADQEGVLTVSLDQIQVDELSAARNPDLKRGSYLKLSVGDTGQGMDPGTLARIFEPFFTTKEKGQGTGMGLAVVHGIVKSHQGAITVSSRPGRGSVFEVFLPLVEPQQVEEPVKKEEAIPRGSERILVVDDEEPLAELVQQAFERLGYQVAMTTDSREALTWIQEDPDRFDLIITDQTMPHLTGDRLAEAALRIRPELPIIICTGFSRRLSPAKAKRIGIRRLIMKPLIIAEMARQIREVLEEAGPPAGAGQKNKTPLRSVRRGEG